MPLWSPSPHIFHIPRAYHVILQHPGQCTRVLVFIPPLQYNLDMRINKWNLKTILKYWLLSAIIICGLSFIIYAIVQQDMRQGANDPQIQMAEDAATQLAGGQQVQTIVPTQKVDIATSLAPYIIIFDNTGKPVASSAQLNGQTPTIPSSVFAYVKQNGEDRITWQPQSGVRSAIVITQFKGANSGFVVAGRSLREVENREDDALHTTLLLMIGMLLITFVATAILFGRPAHPSSPG